MKKISIKWLWLIVIGLWLIIVGALSYSIIKKYTEVHLETIGYWHETEGNITEVLYAGEEKDTAGIKLDVQMIQYDSHEEKRFKDLIENFDDYKLKAGNDCLSVTESGIRAVKPGWCPIFLEKDYRDIDNLKHRIQACIGLYLVIDEKYEGFRVITTPDEFCTLLSDNPYGRFILGNDLDFTGVELQITGFKGVLINPYQYKMKNIKADYPLLGTNSGAYYDGLNIENCRIDDNRQALWYFPIFTDFGASRYRTIFKNMKIVDLHIINESKDCQFYTCRDNSFIVDSEINIHVETSENTKHTEIFPFGGGTQIINSVSKIEVTGPNVSKVSVNVLSNLVADSKIILEGKEYSISSEEKFSYTFS